MECLGLRSGVQVAILVVQDHINGPEKSDPLRTPSLQLRLQIKVLTTPQPAFTVPSQPSAQPLPDVTRITNCGCGMSLYAAF
jgi:hypothetical protein